jgi:site-specific DNA-methyltransferase (adenine-specific)
LPYGTIKGLGGDIEKYKRLSTSDWDEAIEPKKLFELTNRLLRKNGKAVFFSQQPYTNRLQSEAIPNLPHSYNMIWEKDHFANCLLAKKAPVSFYEDILVFRKMNPIHDCEYTHPLRPYFKKVMEFVGLNLKQINAKLGHRRAEHAFYIGSSQFMLCTEDTYNELLQVFGIDKMDGYKPFKELASIDLPFKNSLNSEVNSAYPSTFNLWEGKKYKSNILKYKKDYGGLHPTQKPVLLLEDLIKTFSNEGDTVVDLTMGSGSTGIAALNAGRFFVGIEKGEHYFSVASKRIAEHQKPLF